MDGTSHTIRRLHETIADFESLLGVKPGGGNFLNEILAILKAACDAIDNLSHRVEVLEQKETAN